MGALSNIVPNVIKIVVPGCPSAKGRPRIGNGPGGRAMAFTPPETRKAEEALRSLGLAAMAGRVPLAGPVTLHLLATMEIPASWTKKRKADALLGVELPTVKPDADNMLKLAQDALNGVCYFDDKQIVDIRARKVYGETPGTTIWIAPFKARAAE